MLVQKIPCNIFYVMINTYPGCLNAMRHLTTLSTLIKLATLLDLYLATMPVLSQANFNISLFIVLVWSKYDGANIEL